MRKETLSEAIGRVDDILIEQADRPRKKKRHWKRWTALAACLALVVVGIAAFPRMGGSAEPGNSSTGPAVGPSAFDFYCGPILPLTAIEGGETLTADRDITMDFAQGIFRAGVSDRYTLRNQSEEAVAVTLLYPFVGNLRELSEQQPELYIDGQAAETVLYGGGYTGGFQGAGNTEGLNLKQLDSWEEYEALLSGVGYLNKTLSEHADFSDIPVIVYRFDNPQGEEQSEEIPNPTIRAEFTLDYEKTIVLSYGFHGGRYDRDAGEMGRSFSIRQPSEPGYGESYYLIVLGEDIENLTTQGYVTGGWDTKKNIEHSVDIIRYETDLDTVLNETFDLMYRDWIEIGNWPDGGDRDLWYTLYCDHLAAYGVLSSDVVNRYLDGMLEDSDFAVVDRVFYLEREVTIPAGGTVTLLFNLEKEGSHYVPGGSDEGDGRVYGYDLATQLGSILNFERQTATLINTDQIELVNQNFGFDLLNGIVEVELDLSVNHYYLEVRSK